MTGTYQTHDVAFRLSDGKPSDLRFGSGNMGENDAAHFALRLANKHKRDMVVVLARTDQVVQTIRYQPAPPQEEDLLETWGSAVLDQPVTEFHRTAFLLSQSSRTFIDAFGWRGVILQTHHARTVRQLLKGSDNHHLRLFLEEYNTLTAASHRG